MKDSKNAGMKNARLDNIKTDNVICSQELRRIKKILAKI